LARNGYTPSFYLVIPAAASRLLPVHDRDDLPMPESRAVIDPSSTFPMSIALEAPLGPATRLATGL